MSSLRGATASQRGSRKAIQAARSVDSSRKNGLNAASLRPAVLGLAKLCFLPLVSAAPLLRTRGVHTFEDDDESPADDPGIWAYLGVAIALVLLGGVFAGLTIALMGQDETYLQVIATSGEGKERKHAAKVLNLLKKGKHWVLVTLLLSNVITNETLPIVLDRSLGGGWPAVVSSTVLIVIFGEVAPQSICVRFGLSIGAFMAPYVLVLMWIMSPVAWPTAKLLDYLLGEDHGTSYSKPGLKTLVQLHKTLGGAADRLLEDEVTIISSVLDLKDKAVGDIMTPMQDVFTMSADTVLDEKMMDIILSQGYSRIPIYAPDNSRNFIGMLLVKILITYDPEDQKRVREFALATLPETGPYTSCLDIINFFQEGKSHMVLVSDFPGQDKGANGVVTLEDVIEELIGEEIIDESDVFVDVHKAIRRMAPAPRTKYSKLLAAAEGDADDKADEDTPLLAKENGQLSSRKPSLVNGQSTTFLMRRKSSNASDSHKGPVKPVAVRSDTTDLRKQLKHLGPSNMASKPRSTKYTAVKIKPGVGTIPEGQSTTTGVSESLPNRERSTSFGGSPAAPQQGEGAGLLIDAGRDASGGVNALQEGYVTMHSPERPHSRRRSIGEESTTEGGKAESIKMSPAMASKQAEMNVKTPPEGESREDGDYDYLNNGVKTEKDIESGDAREPRSTPLKVVTSADDPPSNPSATTPTKQPNREPEDKAYLSPGMSRKYGEKLVVGAHHDPDSQSKDDNDTVGEMSAPSRDRSKNRRTARSGSITETTVDINGMKKVVLEPSSSSDDENAQASSPGEKRAGETDGAAERKNGTAVPQIVMKGEGREEGSGSGTNSGTATPTGSGSGGGGGSAAQKKKKKKKGKKGKSA